MTIPVAMDLRRHRVRTCALLLLVAAALESWAGAAPAAAALLDEMSPPSWWAVGGPGNCNDPHSFYSLELGDGFIRWQNGEGNIDVESIDYSYESEFHTTTASSRHVTGRNERVGQGWTYVRMGANLVRVIPGGKSPFLLVRCR
jgi:hypothetical protein